MGIKELNDFLSTDTRKKVFLYYVFSEISPSDIVDATKIPFSTVDRITQLLKAHEILLESEGKDKRETNYTINFEAWIKENLKSMDLDFLDKSEKNYIIKLMNNKKFFVLSYLFNHSDFILDFFREPLKIGADIPFLIMMDMDHINENPAQIPSYLLVHLKFSPVFRKLINDIDNNILENDVKAVNKGIKKYTFVKEMVIDEDDLKEYDKMKTDLILLLRRIFEKKILKISVKKEKKHEDL